MAKKKPPAKPLRGRPPIPDLPRERIFLRASEAEVAAWQAAADALGIGLSTWIRMTCNGRIQVG